MHVAGTFPDNYVYGKCTYYIWEYGEIGENNTYLCTDHAPQVYIPCRIPCSSLVQYSLNCSLITHYSTTLNFKNQLLAIKGTLASLHCCCPSFVATLSGMLKQGEGLRDTKAEAKVTGREVESKPYVARPYAA